MDTRFTTVDPPDPLPPGSRDHHVVLVGGTDSNADLLADALGADWSVERVSPGGDVDCVLSAPSLVSLAVVDVTSATSSVRDLVARLRDHDVPVLLLAASVSPQLRRYAAGRPAFEVLEKPLRRAAFRDAVRRLARD